MDSIVEKTQYDETMCSLSVVNQYRQIRCYYRAWPLVYYTLNVWKEHKYHSTEILTLRHCWYIISSIYAFFRKFAHPSRKSWIHPCDHSHSRTVLEVNIIRNDEPPCYLQTISSIGFKQCVNEIVYLILCRWRHTILIMTMVSTSHTIQC